MAKVKKKKNLSDKKLHTIKKEPKKLNAFEIHVNRKKFNVVGMKSKAERGLPGVSRSRALKKRKATLLQEYKWKDKKNTFLDRRIGEKDSAMTAEDRIMARFTAERAKFHSKKSIFNLGDGEELTHRGQSLTEIEKYDDPKSDDEYDDDEDGKLDADFVGEAHFGGGMLKKVDGEQKSRKDLIDELIAESKKRKAEKRKIKEETLDLTQKLDLEWKELFPLVTCGKKDDESPVEVKKDKKTASYDILSKQLKFEARGKPMDRLKSEEEIAKEEKKKLEALEKERISRMLGESQKPAVKHRSADDLDDGFDFDNNSEFVLSYNEEGLPNMANGASILKDNKVKDSTDESENDDGEEGEEEEEEGEGDEEDDEVEEEMDKDEEETPNEEMENESGNKEDLDEKGDEGEGSSDEEFDDNLSDLKESDESEAELEEENKPKRKKVIEDISDKKKSKGRERVLEGGTEETANNQKSKVLNEIDTQLPYTFEIPNDYEAFEELLNGSDLAKQTTIIERMIKCNHPSLNDSNKEKMETLFTYLLQYLEDSTCESSPEINCFKVLECVAPFMYDLAQWNPDSCADAVVTVLKEKYNTFLKKRKAFPQLDTLIFIKLVSVLYSTSDYRHRVATPSLIFMQHVLSSCRVTSSVDLSLGLFWCTLVLEFCSFSKRYVPEVFNFLNGLLRLCHPKECEVPILLPFRPSDFDVFNLVVADKTTTYPLGKLGLKELTTVDESDEFKVKSVALCLEILSQLCDLMCDKNAAIIMFETFIPLLDSENFSTCLKSNVENVLKKITDMKSKPLRRLVFEKKKPKPLKLYEPKIEEVYSLKKFRPMSKAKQERAKLQQRYKREMKGALREIRRDNAFLSKLKFKEIQKSDIERNRKVREILGSVATQTGEVRKLKRKK